MQSQQQQQPPFAYIVRQPGKDDLEFRSSQEAVRYFIETPGYVKIFAHGKEVMSRGAWMNE